MATLPKQAGILDRAASLGIGVEPSTPTIGAEISGIDLNAPLSSAKAEWLLDAWIHFKVVFFRDADISYESHLRLGRLFGELEGHPVIPHVPGYPEILRIEGVEGVKLTPETLIPFKAHNKWHTDVTFRQQPSIASLLRSRIIPRLGGDTMWADAVAAYEGLPAAVKERIADLDAEHDIIRSFGGRVSEERKVELAEQFPSVRHPVVRSHPVTGEKILYVNHTFTSRIIGLDEGESQTLLRFLFDRFKVPEYQVRFRWTPNALGIWDNRSTQHYAVGDYWPEHRVLERVTVAGDVVRR